MPPHHPAGTCVQLQMALEQLRCSQQDEHAGLLTRVESLVGHMQAAVQLLTSGMATAEA